MRRIPLIWRTFGPSVAISIPALLGNFKNSGPLPDSKLCGCQLPPEQRLHAWQRTSID